ncbi:MAG: aspartoacylase [Cyanobacteria bacterium J06623_7]
MSANTSLNRVAIIGGTHGNELTGAYLIKHLQQNPESIKRSTFDTITILGNPQALKRGTRYVEKDLNRAFQIQDLTNSRLATYEDLRAKEIHQILGDRTQPKVDFIIDLHSTTSNMELTVIVGDEDPLILQLLAYLCQHNPRVRIFSWSNTQANSFLRSLSRRSIAVEIGSIPHGVIDAGWFAATKQLVGQILDFLHSYSQKAISPELFSPTVDIYRGKTIVDYPRNDRGELTAMVSSNLAGKDYQPLHPGEPMFCTFVGREILYTGTSVVYPVFINESSYLEKGIAMVLCEKDTVAIARPR